MKTNLNDIDQLIKETLSEEEAKFYDELEEQNLFGMISSLFQGKNKWLIIIIHIVLLIFVCITIYFISEFLHATETNELIRFGFGATLFGFVSGLIRLFGWMQIHKNAVNREIKRLELQVSSLAGKIA